MLSEVEKVCCDIYNKRVWITPYVSRELKP